MILRRLLFCLVLINFVAGRRPTDPLETGLMGKNVGELQEISKQEKALDDASILREGGIGMTVDEMRKTPLPKVKRSPKCGWFGEAPTCEGECPDSYIELSRASSPGTHDETDFGMKCSSGTKSYCCL